VLFVWIDLAMSFFMQGTLDAATRTASRLIRTGAVQTQGSAAAFAARLCTAGGALLSCAKIQYSVQSAPEFSALNPSPSVDSSGTLTNAQWSPGAASSDILVQVVYSRPILSPGLAGFLGTNGQMTLISSYAFQNEPYQ
jgi:Flp pilus assembly protein TadG